MNDEHRKIREKNSTCAESRRLILERDVNDVFRLYEQLFHKKVNRKQWEWKYLPPWTSEPYAWVGTVGERIIGHIGAVPLRGQIKGEKVLFFQLGDVMADPDYRSLDIYQQLTPAKVVKEIRREHPRAVLYGFTGKQLSLWYAWFAEVGGSTLVERADDRIVRLPPPDHARAELSQFEVREWPWDTPELDEMWLKQKDTIRVGLVRDRAYLEWRYAKHPTIEYSLFGVYHSGTPVGWLVTGKRQVSEQWDDEVRVQDLLLPPQFRLPALQQAASALRARSLVLWQPSHGLPVGIESRNSNWQVMYHSLSPAVSRNFLARRVYYTLGEADEWWW